MLKNAACFGSKIFRDHHILESYNWLDIRSHYKGSESDIMLGCIIVINWENCQWDMLLASLLLSSLWIWAGSNGTVGIIGELNQIICKGFCRDNFLRYPFQLSSRWILDTYIKDMCQSQFVGRATTRRESELNRVIFFLFVVLYQNIAWTYIAIICFSQKFVSVLLQSKKLRQLHCFLIKNKL